MNGNHSNIERLKIITEIQQSEAGLHWNRNNIFLICSSILLLALSQFDIPILKLLIAALGFFLNIAWLLIQYRSSKYILHWKTEAQKLRSRLQSIPDIYPKKLKASRCEKWLFFFLWYLL